MVRNAEGWDYLVEPENGTFAVNITWTGPAFDVGLCCYRASWQLSGYSNDKPFVKEVQLVRKTKLTKKTTMGIETSITDSHLWLASKVKRQAFNNCHKTRKSFFLCVCIGNCPYRVT